MSENNDQRMAEFIQWCRDERAHAINSIERLESGVFQIGSVGPNGIVDGSRRHVEDLRRIAANMDNLIAVYERDHA